MSKRSIKLCVYNKNGRITTSYRSLKEFIKDLYRRDFSYDWDDTFYVSFTREIFEKIRSSYFRKIVVSISNDRTLDSLDLNDPFIHGSLKFPGAIYVACIKFKDHKKMNLRLVHQFCDL